MVPFGIRLVAATGVEVPGDRAVRVHEAVQGIAVQRQADHRRVSARVRLLAQAVRNGVDMVSGVQVDVPPAIVQRGQRVGGQIPCWPIPASPVMFPSPP